LGRDLQEIGECLGLGRDDKDLVTVFEESVPETISKLVDRNSNPGVRECCCDADRILFPN
jgi:hypothetical protein